MRPLPLVVIVIAAVSLALAQPDTTDWSKKTPAEWFEMLKTADVSARRRAVCSLQRTDADAQALALRELLLHVMAHDPDPSVRINAARAVGQHNIVLHAEQELGAAAEFLADMIRGDDAALRQEALFAVREIGAPAAPALPAIRATVRDGSKQDRDLAIMSLPAIGGPALTDLARLLAHDDKDVSWLALNMFQHLREKGRPVAPVLLELVGGKDRSATLHAAAALATVDRRALSNSPEGAAALKTCLDALEATDDTEKGLAMQALSAYGPKAAPAIPRLLKIAAESSKNKQLSTDEKGWAGLLIGTLVQSVGDASFPYLVQELKEGDDENKAMAAALLGNFTTGNFALPEEAVPPLIDMVKTDKPELWTTAADTLPLYRAKAQPAVPALLRHFASEKQRDLQLAAAEALKKIDARALQDAPEAEAMVPALIAELGGANQPADEAARPR